MAYQPNSFDTVYRQAHAVHRAASAFNTGLRGEEYQQQQYGNMSGVGGPMSPPPFPIDATTQPSPHGMAPPPHPEEVLYNTKGNSPHRPSPYEAPTMPEDYGQAPYHYSPSPVHHQYSNTSTNGTHVDMEQNPAMQAILKATQIIFQAADPSGIGKLTKDMAYRVLDMVWGRSSEGSPDESGPRGVLRLSFDRAFDQMDELSVEDFIGILSKVGAPPPYRSQELEYAIITSAKYLQADEESSLYNLQLY